MQTLNNGRKIVEALFASILDWVTWAVLPRTLCRRIALEHRELLFLLLLRWYLLRHAHETLSSRRTQSV